MVLNGHTHWPTLPFRMLHGPKRAYTVTYIHTWRLYIKGLLLYAMLKYLWTGIICTPHFLKSLQKRLAFIDMNRDHSQSAISEWKKKSLPSGVTICEQCVNTTVWTCIYASLNPLYPACPCTKQVYLHLHLLHCHLHITMCQHLWTLLCEHYCVNMHLWIASLNALYPACPCTMQVYLHLHLLHCHLHITMHQHLLTMCEHYCVNMHTVNCFFKSIVPCMSMHKASLSTSTTLPLAYHHVSPCEHYCMNMYVWIVSNAL